MNAPPRSYVETSLGCLAFQRSGSGEPVVLMHGSLVTSDDMVLALMAQLSDRYEVVAFDRPGHGGSAQTPTKQGSPYAQAKMIMEGWRALGIERPIIVGHSFGGAVAMCAAIDAPREVGSVLALAPICFPEVRVEHVMFGPRAASFAGEWLARSIGKVTDLVTLPLLRNSMFFPQVMPSNYAAEYPFAWASTSEMMIADGKDGMASYLALAESAVRYSSCGVPVRIFGGTHDVVVTNARHGLAAASLMPNSTFRWMPGLGHMLHHFCASDICHSVDQMQLERLSQSVRL